MISWKHTQAKFEEKKVITIGIVGGGAAGMAAALFAARKGANVTIFEGNDRLGKKILSTGNGKCNLGNLNVDESRYYSSSPDKLKYYLNCFQPEDTLQFFRELGLFIISKNGYLYPKSEQAASVLDVLRYAIDRNPLIQVKVDCKIIKLEKNIRSSKIILWSAKERFTCDKIILACGSKAAPKTGSDGSGYDLAKYIGHTIIPVVPALVQLRCEEDWFKSVSGVRSEALISVQNGSSILKERGELQLTDYGISGIPVFQLSRQINYLLKKAKSVEVTIDFFPDISLNELKDEVLTTRNKLSDYSTMEEFFSGLLNKKVMAAFIKLAGLRLNDSPGKVDINRILRVCELCKCLKVHVNGSNSFDQAQVCAGGVSLDEMDRHLQSKLVEGVYIIGELLDVDGKCGGYNLHWAWCSGCIAGTSAATNDEWSVK